MVKGHGSFWKEKMLKGFVPVDQLLKLYFHHTWYCIFIRGNIISWKS